ncbi:bifunctional adenosylcobinamide kinase/adenosylcobinamide-phosphate guanylyltransferase [uncultured Metabacillus sp.]|uniref:bifunctional adenosylcobinamide kinase/adenosylcobinamide-phosphate guanylyltransferase n=1 Tax=uncultured Metabacillus sp. TaxID=2860135 RepID=UPI0026340614|nr:bifunctional adenosylcobinamide kinase/adenosylcobinamide-phosphate guanylyltransferase [uncultured Metabacillus sp.]
MVGGAYSGKRKLIRDHYDEITWHSAYQYDLLLDWKIKFRSSSMLVLEGWEVWIKNELKLYSTLDDAKDHFYELIDEICELEKRYEKSVIFIILEMGRGIVPLNEEDRNIRDIAGWVLQYAASKADSVQYCWHGLVKTIK